MISAAANLLWLVPGEVGGSETYLSRQLAPLVSGRHADIDLTVFGLPGLADGHPELAGSVVTAPIKGLSRPVRILTETTWLRGQTRRHDVVHHGGGMIPLGYGGRCVLTVHDVQYLTYPETFSRTKLAYLRSMTPRSVRAAEIVLAPSDYVAGRLADEFGIAPERLRTLPHGVPKIVRPKPTEVADVLRRVGVQQPYVIYPAISYPHKNHLVLLDMLRELPDDLSLVFTGSRWPNEPDIDGRVAELQLGDRVHRLGRVPEQDLWALYSGATATVFPSRYEGFGAPALEAMVLGCPVVAANVTALPEVVGSAGILVSPDDPSAWADAVARLQDPATAAAFVAKGHAVAEGLSDDRSADTLAGAYRDAVA